MGCLEYLVPSNSSIAAKCELERRLIGQGGIWLHSRKVVATTKQEAAMFKLPSGCVQLLG
jgi:hypothetical protein